jgi:hypothetical protein
VFKSAARARRLPTEGVPGGGNFVIAIPPVPHYLVFLGDLSNYNSLGSLIRIFIAAGPILELAFSPDMIESPQIVEGVFSFQALIQELSGPEQHSHTCEQLRE